MDYEAKLEEIAQKIRAIDYESGGNYTLGIIAILRESFPDEGRKNHPVLNPEVLVADIRAEGSPGKGRWKMSHKMAGDAVIAFTKNWAANVLASEAPDSAKGEADELLPCPFCGGKAERIDLDDDETDPNYGGSFIHCPDCFASSKLIFGEKIGLENA